MRLDEWMKENNHTDRSFAELAGLTFGYVNAIKKGRWLPSAQTIRKIQKVTKGEVSDILDFRVVKDVYLVMNSSGTIQSIWEDAQAAVNAKQPNESIVRANVNTKDCLKEYVG
jgi:transcriptional regulator with XRE-family HTH domain